jgi:MFS superfamily sulfate permease-like transporter
LTNTINFNNLRGDLFDGLTTAIVSLPENAIKDASEQGRQVLVVGAGGKVKRRLEKFGIMRFVPTHHMFVERVGALKQPVALVKYNHEVGVNTFNS